LQRSLLAQRFSLPQQRALLRQQLAPLQFALLQRSLNYFVRELLLAQRHLLPLCVQPLLPWLLRLPLVKRPELQLAPG
jgi:hypothetical protein